MRVLAKIIKNGQRCLLCTFSQCFVDSKFHCFLFSQLFSPFVFMGLSNSSKGKCSRLKTGKCDLTPQKWAWGSRSGNSIRNALFPCNCQQQLALSLTSLPRPVFSASTWTDACRGLWVRCAGKSSSRTKPFLPPCSSFHVRNLLLWLSPWSLVSVLYSSDFFSLGVGTATQCLSDLVGTESQIATLSATLLPCYF